MWTTEDSGEDPHINSGLGRLVIFVQMLLVVIVVEVLDVDGIHAGAAGMSLALLMYLYMNESPDRNWNLRSSTVDVAKYKADPHTRIATSGRSSGETG